MTRGHATRVVLVAILATISAVGAGACGGARSGGDTGGVLARSTAPVAAVPPTPTGPSTAGAPAGSVPPSPVTTSASSRSASPTGAAGAAAAAGSSTPAATGSWNDVNPRFPLQVVVSPTCATPGSTVRVEVTTRAHAAIAAGVAFSDDEAHGALGIGAAGPTGTWVWEVVVEPEVPVGRAHVLIAAQDRSADSNEDGAKTDGEGATRREPFEVRKRCG